MARLPRVGGDEGKWGDILNEYLSKSHEPDGTLKVSALPTASATAKGAIQLAGDLAGSADAPTVPALASKYTKPPTGIPEADLHAHVQTKLNAPAGGSDADVAGYIQDDNSQTAGAITAEIARKVNAGANLSRVIARAQAGRPIRTVAVGDSVLQGTTVVTGGGTLGADDCLSLVASDIALRFGVTATTVNHALSGHTVVMGALSLKWNAAVNEQADLVLVGYRANDSAAQRFTTPVRGYPPDAYAAGLERLFRRLRKDSPRSDIAFLIYEDYNSPLSSAENVAITKYADRAIEICAAYGVEVIDVRHRFRAANGTDPNASLYADSIHPNRAGHAELAAEVMEHLPATRVGPSAAMAALPATGLYSPQSIGGGQDTGADFVLAPTTGKWVEAGSGWGSSGSNRTTTTAGDSIDGTFTVTELYAFLDTSTAADLHATLVIDGSAVYSNQPHDANPVGVTWAMLATGLTPGAHTWSLTLNSGTLTVGRVGWLGSIAGGFNPEVTHVVLDSSTTLMQVPAHGSSLTPMPSGSVYLDLPSGWGSADIYLKGWIEYRITGATSSPREIRTRLLYNGSDVRDLRTTEQPVAGNSYLGPFDLSANVIGATTHKLVALNLSLASTDKTLTYLKAYRIEAMLVRRS